MNDPIPVKLERLDTGELLIEWSDGGRQRLSIRRIRDACPCATCLEKARGRERGQQSGQLPVLSPADTMPIEIASMEPAGHFGYRIEFNDGHASGIYSLEILRSLGRDGGRS